MRSRSPSSEHAEAVSRRLATLSAELAAVRGEEPAAIGVDGHTRVRGARPEPAAPVVVQVPGRHASRRFGQALVPTPVHLAVVAVLVAVGLAVTAWLVLGSRAEPVPVSPSSEPVGPAADATPPALFSPGATAGPDAGGDLTVDVAGKVRRPGIAVLPAGSRVVDALEAAGGARPGVDLTSLNLARELVDGEQVLVGVVAAPGAAGAVGSPGSTADGPLVDLNSADQATLETLPGVGPVTAAAILGWRADHGAFTSVDELLEVDGIGEKTLAQIAPHVTI